MPEENEKSISLYHLAEAFSELEEKAKDSVELTEYLEAAELQLKEKVENVIRFQRGMEMSAEAIDLEIERLERLKKSFKSKSDNIKSYLQFVMMKNGVDKFPTSIATISLRNSEGVIVENSEKLPAEYVTEKITLVPDKLRIKQALKAGEHIEGAYLEKRKNIIIK